MNSSSMMGSMNPSLYMDSMSGPSLMKQSRVQFQTQPPVAKPKFVRFTSSTQTGKAVSTVRWLADDDYFGVTDPYATEYFVSGSSSWGDGDNEVSLWQLEVSPSSKEGEKRAQVKLMDKTQVSGNVTGIATLSDGRFCVCTSSGQLHAFKCNRNDQDEYGQLVKAVSKQFFTHKLGNSPASCITSKDNVVVAAGEDGSILESSDGLTVIRKIERADPLCINAICTVTRTEILTGNGGGQIKLWDLRSEGKEPKQTFNPNVLMNKLYGVSSICQHPTQTHAIIVGYQSGCMDLWDLRMGPGADPVANLASEGGAMSEIYFHQLNPDHFFSCAQSGQVCHWYPADKLTNPLHAPLEYSTNLNIEFLRKGLVFKEIHISPYPINSVSLSKNDRLVVGGDSGAVFCTEVRV